MRTLAVVFVLLAAAGLVVLAVAGVTGATAILVTGAAVMAMILLGNVMGGRRTPSGSPVPSSGAVPGPAEGEAEAETELDYRPAAENADGPGEAGAEGGASPERRGPEGTLER